MKKMLLVPLVLSIRLAAQDAPAVAPPPAWTGSFGAGLAVTGGNTDTTTFNLGLNLLYDPKTNLIFKADALYIYGKNNGLTTVDKAAAGARAELKVTPRLFAFGEVRYLRDQFKEINYLISPIIGAGYILYKTDAMTLSVDAGFGGAFESNYSRGRTSSAAFQAGEAFAWKISKTATLTQNFRSLTKLNDTSDTLVHFDVGLAAEIIKNFEVKIAFADDFKNSPPPGVKKNDTALVASILYKF